MNNTTFLYLKFNNNIIIQKADKGNIVVILDWVCFLKQKNCFEIQVNFTKVAINPKQKVNKEVRHLIDIESIIKQSYTSYSYRIQYKTLPRRSS